MLDFVLHGHGVASGWALRAQPGDALVVAGPRGSYQVADDYDAYVLIGDETALPAIARRLAELPEHAQAEVLIEIPMEPTGYPDTVDPGPQTLLAASTLGIGWANAVGAFVVAAVLMVLTGLLPALGRLAQKIPASVASAMLAGVLLPFVLRLFKVAPEEMGLAVGLLIVFIVTRRMWPAWSLPAVLVAAFAVLAFRGQIGLPPGTGLFGGLGPVMPVFDWRIAVSLGLPLFLVTLASQNLPGLVVLRAAGYAPPANRLILATGLTSLIAAPFGAHGVNLAAITAALCTGPDAHPDPAQRWVVGVIYGGFYVVVALFAAPLAGLFIAMPPAVLAIITGLALIAPLTGALGAMLAKPDEREAAVLTFAATGSGVALFGIGSAFWGLVVGFAALAAMRWIRPRA